MVFVLILQYVQNYSGVLIFMITFFFMIGSFFFSIKYINIIKTGNFDRYDIFSPKLTLALLNPMDTKEVHFVPQ